MYGLILPLRHTSTCRISIGWQGRLWDLTRSLFGSDYPLLSPERYFRDMESAGLSPEALIKFKGMNAAVMLGLTQTVITLKILQFTRGFADPNEIPC